VKCPGWERCPTRARKYHKDVVDLKPQTKQEIEKRKAEISQKILQDKSPTKDKSSKRPKPKTGSIEKYIPENMTKTEFVNRVLKHGYAIVKQGKEGNISPDKVKEILSTEVSNYVN
jgi:hypothetical protein